MNVFFIINSTTEHGNSTAHKNYSPAAIIRNAKIWNIILLVDFFRTLSSNLNLEYPAVSEENCLKNLLPLPLLLISWEFRHFKAF